MIMYLTVLETETDRDVFQKLYEENQQKLYYIANKILHNETDAEDAVHNGFLKLADRFSEYRNLSYESLVKLVHTIVKNAAMDFAREYEKKAAFLAEEGFGEDDIPDIGSDVLEQLINRYEQEFITKALMELTEDERELLSLQYGMGMKPKAIGELLGMSSALVRKNMFRCRKKLAEILESGEYQEVFRCRYSSD